jgi:DnaK suppressor protein
MQQVEKEKLRVAMAEKIVKLKDGIDDLKEMTKPVAPDSSYGRISRMDAINNKSVNEASLRKKRIQLTKLEEAFKNIDSPEFGKCIKCGNIIPWGRIVVMPESCLCIKCASRRIS